MFLRQDFQECFLPHVTMTRIVIFIYISKCEIIDHFKGLRNAEVWAKENPTFVKGKWDFGPRKLRRPEMAGKRAIKAGRAIGK